MNVADLHSSDAQRSSDAARRRALRIREWVVLGLLAALVVAAYFNIRLVIVDGHSMEPTFHSRQKVVVLKSYPRDKLAVGDVIVFQADDGVELIKRIVYIRSSDNAKPPLYVWTPKGPRPFLELFAGYSANVDLKRVNPPAADQTIYVMGDNFEHSEDSRDFGPIAPGQILGKVIS